MQICFEGLSCTLSELEKRLSFSFLPQNAFESPEERVEIRERGFSKLNVKPEERARGDRFLNQIQTSYLSPVSIRWVSEKVGYGLFALEPIPKESYVGEYTGIVRRNNRRYTEPLNHYCYEYPVPDRLGISYVIDATQGHLTRFINHSSTPNLQPLYAFENGFYHLIFLALRSLVPGEQLSYDYGANYWHLRGAPALL